VKVLVLDEWIPYPLISGKRLRSYHLLSRAARDNEITYLCFADPDGDGAAGGKAAREHMESLGMRMVTLPRKDPFTPPYRLYAAAALNVLSPRPLVMRKHFGRDYLAKLRELVAAEKFDLVTANGLTTAPMRACRLPFLRRNIRRCRERLYRHEKPHQARRPLRPNGRRWRRSRVGSAGLPSRVCGDEDDRRK
jgi:hypothetical protein